MAYEPTIWKKGDIISSTKLNKLENGVANNGILVVNITGTSQQTVLDKTWQEIHDATLAIVKDVEGGQVRTYFVYDTYSVDGTYYVSFTSYNTTETYNSSSPTGYPQNQQK